MTAAIWWCPFKWVRANWKFNGKYLMEILFKDNRKDILVQNMKELMKVIPNVFFSFSISFVKGHTIHPFIPPHTHTHWKGSLLHFRWILFLFLPILFVDFMISLKVICCILIIIFCIIRFDSIQFRPVYLLSLWNYGKRVLGLGIVNY